MIKIFTDFGFTVRLFTWYSPEQEVIPVNNNEKQTTKWQDAVALQRFQMIAPLQDDGLDPAARIALRRKIALDYGLSEKTVKRYDDAFLLCGFEGLKPQSRKPHNFGNLPENYDELLKEAIQLRREVPGRSVEKIITILELEDRVPPGVLKRSTLQRHLYRAGFGSEHLEVYKDARASSSKRFCKPHRMMLIQGDIKYGICLPIGKNGAKKQTYLSSAIDDHSRYVLFSRFYDNQEGTVVEDTFHNAILRHGAFDRCYFDNGSQYVARQLKLSLAKLSIPISWAPVKSGKSKGKIEKFHQVVDGYLAEARAKKIKTLEDLNHYWEIYLEEYYHKASHAGIREYYESLGVDVPDAGITPLQEFARDTRPLRFLDAKTVGEAFRHHEKRKVDKGACINFQGRRYETKAALIGNTVEISYDPAAPESITVYPDGMEPFQAVPLKITDYCDQKPVLPPSAEVIEPETSRFLDALEKRREKNMKRAADAISFGNYRKGVKSDV